MPLQLLYSIQELYKTNLILFVGMELCIDPLGVEVSLVLNPLSLCWLLRWRVGGASRFARRGVRLVVIGQSRENIPAGLAMLVP